MNIDYDSLFKGVSTELKPLYLLYGQEQYLVDTVIKVVEKECICPNIENDGCLNDKIEDEITNKPESKLININTADKEELQQINGIGESKANNIIKYREEHGNFKNIEELKNVEGIGDNLYETIKIYITT